jgi:DNA-binding transcriptional MerR regulator
VTVTALEPWQTTAEIAEFFGVSERTIRYWRAAGMPSAIIAGRRKHRPSECEPWLERAGHLRRNTA